MKKVVHKLASCVAILCIAIFWCSTVVSELLLSEPAVVFVKTAILWAMLLFIPAMALTGATGATMAYCDSSGQLRYKKIRMALIAVNGLFILLPSAFYLQHLSVIQQFNMTFIVVQGVELIAGAVNFSLMVCNFRVGLRLRQCRSPKLVCN